MAQIWTNEQVDYLSKYLSLSNQELTVKYNDYFGASRSYDSISKKAKLLRLLKEVAYEEKENDISFEELPKLEKKDFGEKLDKWLTFVSQGYTGIEHKIFQSSNSSLCIFLSDLHFGKRQKNFNLETAKQAIASIPSQILNQYSSRNFDEIVLHLGGDEVDGEDIFPTQNGKLECPVIFQMQAVVESLFQLILDLRQTFNVKVRVETTYGNHGRMSKTADDRSNWDNATHMMLYKLCEMECDKDIVFNLNFEAYKVVNIKDKRILLTHHGVQHLGTKATQAKFLGWVFMFDVDAVIHGHWHNWKVESHMGRIMISNGSLSGPDDLSEDMGVEEPPRQAIFLVTPHQPISQFSFLQWDF